MECSGLKVMEPRSSSSEPRVHGSLFEQDWWCDASSPGEWGIAEYREDGVMVGSLIYQLKRARGFRRITMPYLARTMEPYIRITQKKDVTKTLRQMKILNILTAKLPPHDRFSYMLPPGSQLEMAFNLCDFQTSNHFTFRHDPAAGGDAWSEMDQKARNIIKTSKLHFHVERHQDFDRYQSLSRDWFAAAKKTDLNDYDAIRRVWDACGQRNKSMIISAANEHLTDAATAVLLWDETFLYYWLAARDPLLSKNSAVSLLIWSALEIAEEKGLIFDTDGFSSTSGGVFFAKFGLTPHRRVQVTRTTALWDLASASQHLLKAIRL